MSQLSVNTITNAAGGNTAQINGMTPTADSLQGFRNRIINGDMRIDQRNNGAAVTNASTYTLDRWSDSKAGSGQYTAQQSTTAPTGFTNSFQHTVTTAVSPAAGDVYQLVQTIEGFNTADLGFGTANAQSVTLSFWVRSSITGSWAASLSNNTSSGRRSYVATYTISAANTWEYKTITIPGDTTGAWATNNTVGIAVHFDQGSGSNHNATAGVWTASSGTNEGRRTSGTVNLISTSGATFYITGVQLEAGSVATPFERRPYGTELALCRRYLPAYSLGSSGSIGSGMCITSSSAMIFTPFDVPARVAPTGLTVSSASQFLCWQANTVGTTPTSITLNQATPYGGLLYPQGMSGLVAGNATHLLSQNASAQILFNGCEL